jgi:hypothetical protein
VNATGPVDPLVRAEPPFDWYRTPVIMPRRVETPGHLPDLDPDIALWPVTPLQRWPFTGAPSEGIWPKGWAGVDNTGTMYVCTVGGQPGTWVAVGSGGGSGWPTVNGTGAGNLTAQTGSGDTVGYNLTDAGTGGISIQTTNPANANGILIEDQSVSGMFIRTTYTGGAGLKIEDAGTGGVTIDTTVSGPILINQAGSAGITIETTGGGATTGIALTTQATDTGGVVVTNNSSTGITIGDTGVGGIHVASNGTVAVAASGSAALSLSQTGTGGITVTTGASTTGGMTFSDSGSGGMAFVESGGGGLLFHDTGGAGILFITSGGLTLEGVDIGFYTTAPVAQPAAIPAPSGGAVVDVECRAAVVSILNAIGGSAGGIGITA